MVRKSSLRYKSVLSIGVLFLSMLFMGCVSGEDDKPAVTEGTLKYKVTYPGRSEGGLLDGVLPKEMTMIFKGNKYVNTISAVGMFDSKVIADGDAKTVTLTFHFGPKKMYTVMDAEVADSLLNAQFGIPDLIEVEGMEEVAGFDCKRTFAVFDDFEDGPDFEVKYTNDIAIEDPNWCNQFKELDAVLLEYELKQYGMRLKLRASEFIEGPVDDKVFEVGDDYELVSVEMMVHQFEEVFINFQ